MSNMHKQIMPGEHIYLLAIATDPKHQGQGHAKKLIQRAITDAKNRRLPIYLETADPKNVEIYKKMGFQLAGQRQLNNLTQWGMIFQTTDQKV